MKTLVDLFWPVCFGCFSYVIRSLNCDRNSIRAMHSLYDKSAQFRYYATEDFYWCCTMVNIFLHSLSYTYFSVGLGFSEDHYLLRATCFGARTVPQNFGTIGKKENWKTLMKTSIIRPVWGDCAAIFRCGSIIRIYHSDSYLFDRCDKQSEQFVTKF